MEGKMKRSISASRRRGDRIGYALLAPSLFGVVIFLLTPIVVVTWLSFQKWDLVAPLKFVGLSNWLAVLGDPTFIDSLMTTVLFVVLVIPAQTALGLFAAVLLSRRLPGSGVFRVIYVIPWVSAPLALGIVWRWIFQPTGGMLNVLLGSHVPWLTLPSLALPAVSIVSIWSQTGYVTLFFMAGLAVIPEQLVEAARIDGAGSTRIFWSIKLPLLRPTLFFVLVTTVISAFQVFDTIYSLTQGGPQNATDIIAYRIYEKAFTGFDLGQAAVTALILFLILVAITVGQQLYFRRRITYDLS
ncbi:sugar ABC transporter permease [Sinomonas atrocyanea]|uniref:Sugar ABC transporter permease n=2 Tax=Sinomonas atrocyanea TaxID=37927 RepID=A0A126ZYB4_9MICC|nr:sugar ABC transporter permease [Sinomonas atrocyanea]GEB66353.1 sugar ABC transporter permease [Sinomonas atrocyanea]GGG70115.1 sugar ABC transporter permease [Sinomonas atrocyanea]